MLSDVCVSLSLFRSPYLDIAVSAQTGKGTIFNIISGKRFEVSPAVIGILNFFGQPATADSLLNTMDIDPDTLTGTIAFLQRNGLLIDPSHAGWEEFTTNVIAVKNRLFGVDAYNSEADVVLVGIPFGKGNGKSMGGAGFPFHSREYGQANNLMLKGSNFPMFDCATAARLRSLFRAGRVVDQGNLFISANESTAFVYAKMEQMAYQLFSAHQVPVFIGGDHSISYPLIKAAARVHPNLHVIHFDAHTDTYGSRYDAVEHWGKVHHYGNFMTHCLALDGVKNVYQFGIRGFANAGAKARPKQYINWREQVSQQLQAGIPFDLPADVPYYVTFDVDVLDPTVLPGTATPVAGGFSLDEINQLFAHLLPGRHLVGVDVVEANPDFDRTDLTTQVTLEIMLRLMSYLPIRK
jgi:agmatinase